MKLAVWPVLLTGVFWWMMAGSIRHQSQTIDEGFHLVAGYRYWQCGDFGINSEHPPLAKMVAAAPLWIDHVPAPPGTCGKDQTTKDYGYGLGYNYLYSGQVDADALLYRARLSASVFAVLLAIGCYALGRVLFGATAGVIALLLLVFEPTILAHGALITTDTALSAFLLLAVLAFHLYSRSRKLVWQLVTGVFTGLTLSAKHSGVLIVPILLGLASFEFGWETLHEKTNSAALRSWLRRAGELGAVFLIAIAVLWTTYGWRYAARPGGEAMTLPLGDFIANARQQGTHGFILTTAIPALAQWHLLPEPYLYGLVDVLNVSDPGQPPFLLGKLYPNGRWYYFPVAFIIKATIGFLVLLLLALVAGCWTSSDRVLPFAYLSVPPVILLLVASRSGLNIGLRHVLPMLAFFCVLIAGAVALLWKRGVAWRIVVVTLMLAHAVSSLHAYPNYLAYSNEAWGGPLNTYRYLTDSNVDWGNGLYQTRDYLRTNHLTDCWLAYDGVASLVYYGIPCRPLSASIGEYTEVPPLAATGTFVLSALTVSGIEWEPGELNPYHAFQKTKPVANIAGAMLVYQGTFDLGGVAAVEHIAHSMRLLGEGKISDALTEAQAAMSLTPDSVRAHLAAGKAQVALRRREEAQQELEMVLHLARRAGTAWYPIQIADARRELQKLRDTATLAPGPRVRQPRMQLSIEGFEHRPSAN
ncbi:MAG: glycosyltransferase family 39 protein [Terriglobales bacterium]